MSAPELSVLFEAAGVACAVPARLVVRLAIAEEAELQPSPPSAAWPALLGVVRLGRERFAAWDLGVLLARPAEQTAWIGLRLQLPDGPVALALRTGRCSSVAPVRPSARLPSTLFSARGGGLRGVFEVPGGEPDGRAGLLLDPERLFLAGELARSGELLGGR